jgi:TonB-linked SusC/RagA family outer membrane protein
MNKILWRSRLKTISVILTVMLVGSFFISLNARNKSLIEQPGQTITGKIITAEGEELPGVNIIIQGTTLGTVSDINGNFSLDVPSEYLSGNLQVSYVGYLTEVVNIGGLTEINVTLIPDLQQLEEIVVVGYGVQKKSDLTGAIASVTGDKISEVAVSGVDLALQGRAAGVYVTSESGAPGSDVVVQVRGISSVNKNDPLYVIDGAISSHYAISALNPNDIESIEVLKDASSAAIYGASGGNGVILITTKKGEKGKVKAELDYYYGIQNAHRRVEMCNPEEFFSIYNDIMPPARQWPDSVIEGLPSYNYQDLLYKNAPMHSINLSVSGGNEASTYRFSAGYFYQGGVVPPSKYTRLNLRINSSHKIGKRITFGENISLSNETYWGYENWRINHGYNSPISQAIQMHPFVEPYDSAGNWSTSPLSNVTNPFVEVDNTDRELPEYRAFGDLNLQLDIVKGLFYKTIFGASLDMRHDRNFVPAYFFNPTKNNPSSQLQRREQRTYSWSWQHVLQYDFSLLNSYNFSLMGGFESGYSLYEWSEGTRYDLINETREMHYFDASLDEGSITLNGGGNEIASYAYFGRVNFDYKGKYLFTFNIRNDYSSKFGPENRSGLFPAFSAGWKFSEEGFIQNIPFLSFGKIRGGWGQMGNSNIDPYKYYAVVRAENVYTYAIDNTMPPTTGASLHGIPNRALHWEAMNSTNIGVDLGFLENRISVTADYFVKNNEGMLLERPLPAIAGTYQESPSNEGGPTEYVMNIGNNKNTGIEATIGFKNITGKFRHAVDLNFTWVKNEVGNISGDTLISPVTAYTFSNMTLSTQGYPLGSLYGFVTDGLFTEEDAQMIEGRLVVTNQPFRILSTGAISYMQPNAQPGDIRFVDINGDSLLNQSDRAIVGNPHPKFLVGFSYSLNFMNFDLSMFWQGAFGHDIFQLNKVWLYNTSGNTNWCKDALNRYRSPVYDVDGVTILDPGNTDTDLFRISVSDRNINLRLSDWFVEKGGYLRMKNIQIGYSLPENITNKLGLEKFRVYAGAKDLITITKYPGLDPEIYTDREDPTNRGIDLGVYQKPRVFLFGFNATF